MVVFFFIVLVFKLFRVLCEIRAYYYRDNREAILLNIFLLMVRLAIRNMRFEAIL